MNLRDRARIHAALGDELRLRLVDALWLNDRSPQDLGMQLGVDSNLLAHHLDVLERAGVVSRTVSAGDGRRRYVSARLDVLQGLVEPPGIQARSVLFVCTHNSARSLFAESLLSGFGVAAQSAGTHPAEGAHPKAVTAASEVDIDLKGRRPKPYSAIEGEPDLVVTVCDRARESSLPFRRARLHWSIPDPVDSARIDGFRTAFADIARRVTSLTEIIEKENTKS